MEWKDRRYIRDTNQVQEEQFRDGMMMGHKLSIKLQDNGPQYIRIRQTSLTYDRASSDINATWLSQKCNRNNI